MTVVVKYGGNALAGATESDAMDQFAFDVVHASVQVSAQALHIGKEPRGAVIRVPLRSAR